MSQHFLYHWVPKNMKGNILYPLNQLKNIEPELYAEHMKKYDGRENLLDRKIPILDCLWNDVLHLTAVHPDKIVAAMNEAGIEAKSHTCFQIPAELLIGQNTIAFFHNQLFPTTDEKFYEYFTLDHMDKYVQIPQETIEYYKKCRAQGKKPLVHHLVPHILYKGKIDTSDLTTIN